MWLLVAIVAGCHGTSHETGTLTGDTADSAGTTRVIDTDRCRNDTGPCYRYRQRATVLPAEAYQGTVELSITKADGTEGCLYDWSAVGGVMDVRADCPGCTFAFSVKLSHGLMVSGTCARAGLQPDGTATVGFAPAFSYEYNGHSYAWKDVAMTYQASEKRWYPFADGTFVGTTFLSEARFAQTYSY